MVVNPCNSPKSGLRRTEYDSHVLVTDELLAAMQLQIGGKPATAGVHHGSLWHDGFGDKTQFLLNTHVDNRPAFATLHLLYYR